MNKEELVKELTRISEDNYYPVTLDKIADFILKDRARIVEPLVKLRLDWDEDLNYSTADLAIEETIKLAGLSEGATNA